MELVISHVNRDAAGSLHDTVFVINELECITKTSRSLVIRGVYNQLKLRIWRTKSDKFES